MSDQIVPGDIVQLKSGSVSMTVGKVHSNYGTVQLFWYDNETKSLKVQDQVYKMALKKVEI